MPTLSIIIPCYNEERTLGTLLELVHTVPLSIDKEIIVIDDASTDNTSRIIDVYASKIDTLIRQDTNQGKGAAISKGVSVATGDYLIIQDADLEYDPHDYESLLEPLLENEADVVYGSRFLDPKRLGEKYLAHTIANKGLTALSNVFTTFNVTDMETCYKVFTKSVYTRLTITETRFGMEPEITAKLSKMNIRLLERPISYNGRNYSAGKKIGFRDGVRALYCILKYNLIA
jgi:glycosyltransferase involved in cell wall biosynthesis